MLLPSLLALPTLLVGATPRDKDKKAGVIAACERFRAFERVRLAG
jgi:hypothetical protein